MTVCCVQQTEDPVTPDSVSVDQLDFERANELLATMTPLQRVEWSLAELPGEHVLTSSFGAQSAVSLHMFNEVCPGIPVILIDTGYLFPETYQFIDALTERLQLNLQIFRAKMSPAWQEARFGLLWEQGLNGIEQYNQLNKVEPLKRALKTLHAGTWYAGLRRTQSQSRKDVPFVRAQDHRFKVHPIADQSNKALHDYLKHHQLPYHPLWAKGYVSIGDKHTTRPLSEAMNEEDTRFFGLKRECGIHEI